MQGQAEPTFENISNF
jgi:hypothetical protein